MEQKTEATDLRGLGHSVILNTYPDRCPVCHSAMYPQVRSRAYLTSESVSQILVAFQCTHQQCQELFIGYYRQEGRSTFILQRTAPKTAEEKEFSDVISGLSPSFMVIYNQALAAEAANLDQIVGIGLRKALEFLIKDYAIRQKPDEEEKIRKMFLGKCIKTYVEDRYVKECAKRAAWLGNDEAHYIRRWKERDIEDLKILIQLTVNWITNVLLTEQFISDMPDTSAS